MSIVSLLLAPHLKFKKKIPFNDDDDDFGEEMRPVGGPRSHLFDERLNGSSSSVIHPIWAEFK